MLDLPGLRVLAASPRYLLAMKCLAARREDEDDIRLEEIFSYVLDDRADANPPRYRDDQGH